ncbi:hypothetical protein L1987_62553 [Smallanthus sonchifolius]|uniref:Uncharacterized protein n=1 Tax=Smallanthus sonchifolius TaxID=185202 RepID=A0ACB9CAS8_9ASTR|nr:hypothetical protein L1987_62553 [Smallanthus sonchifolius]
MYAETGLIFPNFQSSSSDLQQFYDLSNSHNSNAYLGSMVQSCNISDYDVGGEGDLFKASELMMEQPVISELNDEFLSNVFKEILEKEAETEISPLSEVLNYKFTNESSTVKENVHPPGKSMSSDCLNSLNQVHGTQIEPGFLDVTELDFENVYGMRRAFSDGDIKALANRNGSYRRSSLGQPQLMSDHIIEDRWQKLSRYRNKKTKRNFGRKIKEGIGRQSTKDQGKVCHQGRRK